MNPTGLVLNFRVIADHGKEARFPFLDEELVSYLNHLPVNKKVCYGFLQVVLIVKAARSLLK